MANVLVNDASLTAIGNAIRAKNGINGKLKIVVPDNLYSTWIATSPWNNATLTAKIMSATDYAASLVE